MFPHIIHSTRTTVFPHAIQQLQDNSTYRINSSSRILQEILQVQGSSRADHYKASSSDCSRVSKHSTWQNPAIRPLQHKQASSNSTQQKQHSKRQPASTHSLQQFPDKLHRNPLGTTKNSTRRNRIHSKGLSIVCPCNTKVSVFQITY